MTQIELRGVQKFFGAVQVIKDLNLKIDDNEFIVCSASRAAARPRRCAPSPGWRPSTRATS